MQSSFTGVNLNGTFDLSPRYSSLVCGEVICSNNRRPMLTKYSLNSLATSWISYCAIPYEKLIRKFTFCFSM